MRAVAAMLVFGLAGSIRVVKIATSDSENEVTFEMEADTEMDEAVFAELDLDLNSTINSDQSIFKSLINNYRQTLGAKKLCYNSALNKAAHDHAMDLFKKGLSARHNMPDGSCHTYRMAKAGYCWEKGGECAGGGRKSVTHMFNGWKASPTHDRQMKNPNYNEMGMWCNPRTTDKKYRCVLKLAKRASGPRCCVENDCVESERAPKKKCGTERCCDNSARPKFSICGS